MFGLKLLCESYSFLMCWIKIAFFKKTSIRPITKSLAMWIKSRTGSRSEGQERISSIAGRRGGRRFAGEREGVVLENGV